VSFLSYSLSILDESLLFLIHLTVCLDFSRNWLKSINWIKWFVPNNLWTVSELENKVFPTDKLELLLKYSLQFIAFTVHQSVFQKNCFFCNWCLSNRFLVSNLIWFLFWINLSVLICSWSKSLKLLHNSLNYLLLTAFQKTA